MLLERCSPGTPLRNLGEPEQDEIIAKLLRELWREPPKSHRFRPLAEMIASWSVQTREAMDQWSDQSLVEEGLIAFAELAGSDTPAVLLATDLHAGNVLRAERAKWLVIDPKPFVGDPCYDATQHLLNCRERMSEKPLDTVQRFAGLLDIEEARLRQWTFARFAVNYGEDSASMSKVAAKLAG
jgi:streptomycin 6-kinase